MGALLDILRGKVAGSELLRDQSKPVSGAVASSTSASRPLYLDPRAREYSASAIAYRCVAAIASNGASVDLEIARDDAAVEGHPISLLWNKRPTDGTVISARMLKETALAQLELTGEAFIYQDRGPTGEGEIRGLWPIFDPVQVYVSQRIAGRLEGFVVRTPAGPVPLLPAEVLWLRYPDPFDPWAGLAPWKAALWAADADAYARAWQKGEFVNGARPSMVVYLGDLDEEAHRAAVADFRSNVEGVANAGKSMLVSSAVPATASRLTLTPAEMSYLESRTKNGEEIMVAFAVPKDYLMGGATYENRRASKGTLWSDAIVPKLDTIASQIDLQQLPDDREEARWDLSTVEALQEGEDARWTRVSSAAAVDLMLLDEARAQLGLDQLPGGIGQQTITAYRQSLLSSAQAALGGLPASGPARWAIPAAVGPAGAAAALLGPPQAGDGAGDRIAGRLELEERRVPRRLSRTNVERFYDRHERLGQRAVRKIAEKQLRVVLRTLDKIAGRQGGLADLLARAAADAEGIRIGSSPWTELPVSVSEVTLERIAADDLYDAAFWRTWTADQLEAFLSGVWEGGATNAAEAFGISFDFFDARVLTAMSARLDVLAQSVTATTRAILDAQLLQAGVEEGESVEQLAARIRAVFADLAGYRAETIARTETVGGFNAASRQAAIASGVVTARTWLATKDARTREEHREMDGQTVQGLDQRYPNGLLHPGEPGAPAHQVINCRCVETYDVED